VSYNYTNSPYGINYAVVEYTPDVTITNGSLSFDIGVLDITGNDFADIPFNVTITEKDSGNNIY